MLQTCHGQQFTSVGSCVRRSAAVGVESRPECLDPNLALLRRTGFGCASLAKTAIYCCSNQSDARPCPDTAGNLANVGLRFPCPHRGATFMMNPRRLDVIRIFALSALLLTPSAISWAQQRPPIADKMAKAHGLDSSGKSREFATPSMWNVPTSTFP